MLQFGDILSVLQSLLMASAMTAAAYGFGRPLARLFGHDATDQFERGIRSLLLGFPAAGLGLAALALLGCIGTISVSLFTMFGIVLTCVEVACSAAGGSGIRGTIATIRRELQPTSGLGRVLCCAAAVILVATLIMALAPPTNPAVLGEALEPSKETLQAGTFRTGEQGGLRLLPLPQIWSLWGLALDGPVAANLVQWQLMILVALAAVLLARRWIRLEFAWLAGLLFLLSPVCWSAQGPLAFGAGSGLGVPLLLLAAGEMPRQGRRVTGEFNFALATLVTSLPVAAIATEFSVWQSPLLLIAVSGLVLGSPRQRLVLAGTLAALLAGMLGPGGVSLFVMALPVAAVAGAMGAMRLLRLNGPGRMALAGFVGCLVCVQLGDLVRTALPKAAVAVGWQSRHDYLLTASGSYRAAMVFNQIRQPEQRLYSTISGCVYFASPTTVAARDRQAILDGAPAARAAAAHQQGCDYMLLAEPLDRPAGGHSAGDASELATATGEGSLAEKFAGAVEVIPIVQYEFADEYQRTTRYRLWKLQSRRAAASPVFQSATSGEEVSSRPRPPTR